MSPKAKVVGSLEFNETRVLIKETNQHNEIKKCIRSSNQMRTPKKESVIIDIMYIYIYTLGKAFQLFPQ